MGTGFSKDSGPIIRLDGIVHEWPLRYSPWVADGKGEITMTFAQQKFALKPEHQKTGSSLDHFGLFNAQIGKHFVGVSLDDLSYTVGRK